MSKKSSMKIMLMISIIFFALIIFSAPLLAKVNIKIAMDDPLDYNDALGAGMMKFKDLVESRSNGEITVQLFPNSQLGTTVEMLDQAKRGTVQMMSGATLSQLASIFYPDFMVFDIPYLFRSEMSVFDIINPQNEFMRGLIEDMAAKTGMRIGYEYCGGFRQTTNSVREIKEPQDFKNLKIRTMEVEAHKEMMKALGASPTPIAYQELYSAMQTGVVDGQENPIKNIWVKSMFEVQDYLTMDSHIAHICGVVMNEKFYQSLSEEHKSIIDEAMQQCFILSTGVAQKLNLEMLDVLKEKGMKVTYLTDEQHNLFKEATQPAVLEFIRKGVDNESVIDELYRQIEIVEKKYG